MTNHVARLVPCDQHLYIQCFLFIYVNNVSRGNIVFVYKCIYKLKINNVMSQNFELLHKQILFMAY